MESWKKNVYMSMPHVDVFKACLVFPVLTFSKHVWFSLSCFLLNNSSKNTNFRKDVIIGTTNTSNSKKKCASAFSMGNTRTAPLKMTEASLQLY